MGRKKVILTKEQAAEHKAEANRKYRQKQKGKEKTAEAIKRYQQSDKYKEYKKRYYLEKKKDTK